VVALQVQRTDFVSGVATFISYGLGMSILLVGVTVAVGLGQQRLVGWLRGSARYLNRVAGVILILAGGYIVWFWSTNIGSGAGALGEAGPFRFVENLSQRALRVIGDNPVAWGLGLGAIIAAAILYVLLTRDHPDTGNDETPEQESVPHMADAA
jgi:hypothetical protein